MLLELAGYGVALLAWPAPKDETGYKLAIHDVPAFTRDRVYELAHKHKAGLVELLMADDAYSSAVLAEGGSETGQVVV